MNNKINIAIIGTGSRARAFVHEIKRIEYADLSWLCDVNPDRLISFIRQRNVQNVQHTTNLNDVLADSSLDGVILTVPDRFHKDVAIQCINAKKHIMLEKPMALTADDCRTIIAASKTAGRILQVGFVLRATPFYRKIKELVDSGTFGQIMNISAAEYLGFSHSSSYMRRWHRKTENSGSFLLAKCSHDLDLLCWLTSSLPVRVSSFGDNNFFMPSKQPATHCSKCPILSKCPFKFDDGFVFMTEEDRINPSKNNFDICVYNSDKDIVDNQVCIMEFANGVRAMFSLQLFNPLGSQRYITITGTKAYLRGCLEENRFEIIYADNQRKETVEIPIDENSGHAGGDGQFLIEFINAIRDNKPVVADAKDGMASTVIGNAIEKARAAAAVITIDAKEYI